MLAIIGQVRINACLLEWLGVIFIKRPLSAAAFVMLPSSSGKRESICKAEVTSCSSLGFWLMCWLIISIVAMFIEACPEPVEGLVHYRPAQSLS